MELYKAKKSCFQKYALERDNLNFYSYMIISNEKKFIYFDYPKTASSSVKTMIFPYLYREYCGLGAYLKYFGKKTIKKVLGRKTSTWPFGGLGDTTWRKIMPQAHFTDNIYEQKFDEYFKFSVVRNPFDKMVSAYKHGAWGVIDQRKESFEDFILSLLPGGKREIKDLSDRGLNHFVPWTSLFDINRTDFIMRLESLNKDIKFVVRKIRLPANLEKHNISRKDNNYRSYYNRETREIVSELYKKDLEVFGYRF